MAEHINSKQDVGTENPQTNGIKNGTNWIEYCVLYKSASQVNQHIAIVLHSQTDKGQKFKNSLGLCIQWKWLYSNMLSMVNCTGCEVC